MPRNHKTPENRTGRRLRDPLSRREFLRGAAAMCAGTLLSRKAAAATPSPRPNVVFLLTDQQRFPYMGAYGQIPVRTPAMDGIARRGALFTHAFCSTPQCSASRSSIMTGLYPHSTGVFGNIGAAGGEPLNTDIPSLGKLFRASGYRTGYLGKWHLGGEPREHGFEVFHGCGRGVGEAVAERSSEFVRESTEPFLLFSSFVNPHDIYGFRTIAKTIERSKREIKLPANFRDDLSKKPSPQLQYLREDQGKAVAKLTDEGWIDYLNVYEYLVEKVDQNIGKILDALQRRGVEKSTIVVFSSDHGDHCGGHGLPFKGPAMYDELVRIPLAISYPGRIAPGLRLQNLTVNVDLLPTVCQLAGLPAPKGIHGRSLVPLLQGERIPWRDYVIGEYYSKQRWVNPIRMVRTTNWKYTRYRKWGEELYDLVNDPGELNNLAQGDAHTAVKQKLSDTLDRWMEDTRDPFSTLFPTDRSGQPV
jgi:arylsulfatase A-like enzyme